MSNRDFSFAWEGAESVPTKWSHLQVVEFEGLERMSELYRYGVTLVARHPAPEVDPEDLIGKRASLRIATQSKPAFKLVHGIVDEADEIDEAREGMVYRVRIVPAWSRSLHKKRCRLFLDKTVRQIVDAVLGRDARMAKNDAAEPDDDDGDEAFEAAKDVFAWRVRDARRIDDPRARPYVVQYNESDHAFVSRLLEAEGIAYHFENGRGRCILVLSDHDGGRRRLAHGDEIGAGVDGREIESVAASAELRPRKVAVHDYDWRKPSLALRAEARAGDGDDLVEEHQFAGFPDAPEKGEGLAKAIADRHHTEANYVTMKGGVRVLHAGSVFKLRDRHADDDGEYLATGLRVSGSQAGVLSGDAGGRDRPFRAKIVAARRGKGAKVEESRFRPAMKTPKPRIHGTQTALVTADPSAPSAEINVGGQDGIQLGSSRLRFRWDDEHERLANEPSSTWVRSSQIFAGKNEGGVWHARVGTEVLVDHEDGDPDRPVIIGRVYNGANVSAHGAGHMSSFKSFATPGGGAHNEFSMGDGAGGEMLHFNAGKNHTADVANVRRESIAASAKMSVGATNTETIAVNSLVSIGANASLDVAASQLNMIGANSSTTVGANSKKTVGAAQLNIVGGNQSIRIGGNLKETVGGVVMEMNGGSRKTKVAGAVTEDFGAIRTLLVGGSFKESSASHELRVGAAQLAFIAGHYKTVTSGAVTEKLGAAHLNVTLTSQTVKAPKVDHKAPLYVTLMAGEFKAGWNEGADGKPIGIALAGIEAKAGGVTAEANGIKIGLGGPGAFVAARYLRLVGMAFELFGAKTSATAVNCDSGGVGIR